MKAKAPHLFASARMFHFEVREYFPPQRGWKYQKDIPARKTCCCLVDHSSVCSFPSSCNFVTVLYFLSLFPQFAADICAKKNLLLFAALTIESS